MSELSVLRQRLKDRQTKAGALGTTEVTICLDAELLADLRQLESDRALLVASGSPAQSLADTPDKPNTSQIEYDLEAKRQEIRAASITVVFRALSSVQYQQIVNGFDDPDDADQVAWLDALAAESFYEVWSDGEKVDLTWDEIAPATHFGELDDIRTKVFNLNRRKQDIPFSSKPSKDRSTSAGKPKPA